VLLQRSFGTRLSATLHRNFCSRDPARGLLADAPQCWCRPFAQNVLGAASAGAPPLLSLCAALLSPRLKPSHVPN
jgi:hypothetical protein